MRSRVIFVRSAMVDERDELSDEELERLDRFAREDIGNRDTNIGTIARARTIRRLVEEVRRARAELERRGNGE